MCKYANNFILIDKHASHNQVINLSQTIVTNIGKLLISYL